MNVEAPKIALDVKFNICYSTKSLKKVLERQMSRIPILLLVFLPGFIGCQTTPAQPLGNIFSQATTIPPPGTNSYTVNSAPSQETLTASNSPANSTDSEGVSPFAPNRPYADSQDVTEAAVQPFGAQAPVESAGSVKVAARTGDEIMIPVNAFRSDTGLYSSDSSPPQSSATATDTFYVAPFQGP